MDSKVIAFGGHHHRGDETVVRHVSGGSKELRAITADDVAYERGTEADGV